MSKESRRRQRQAGQVPATGPSADRPPGTRSASAPPTRSTGPRGTERAGRRDRARAISRGSFFERYRSLILGAAIVAVLAVVGAGLVSTATAEAYACSRVWEPDPTSSPSQGASPQPGYAQPDMGGAHVPNRTSVTYTYCPPASGRQWDGGSPIDPKPYAPNDAVVPQGWIHNLEHGSLVLLYRGEVDQATQDALRAFYDDYPPSPVCGLEAGTGTGPVFARFDEMAWPFAALVWGRVLPLQSLDTAAVLAFDATYGERTSPEQACEPPPSAEPSGAPSPSAGSGGSAVPSGPATTAPASAAPSAPASAAPSATASAPASASPS